MDTWVLSVWLESLTGTCPSKPKKTVFLLSLLGASVGSNFQESWGFPETGEEEARER